MVGTSHQSVPEMAIDVLSQSLIIDNVDWCSHRWIPLPGGWSGRLSPWPTSGFCRLPIFFKPIWPIKCHKMPILVGQYSQCANMIGPMFIQLSHAHEATCCTSPEGSNMWVSFESRVLQNLTARHHVPSEPWQQGVQGETRCSSSLL